MRLQVSLAVATLSTSLPAPRQTIVGLLKVAEAVVDALAEGVGPRPLFSHTGPSVRQGIQRPIVVGYHTCVAETVLPWRKTDEQMAYLDTKWR